MTILEHEHSFEAVYYADQMFLTDTQKERLGVDVTADLYTSEMCTIKPCTATKLDSSKKPLAEQPIVDLDAYKLSTTGDF